MERGPTHLTGDPDLLLDLACSYERKGQLENAAAGFRAAAHSAEASDDARTLAEALRRLAVIRHRMGQSSEARALASRSREIALQDGQVALAAEALNALGGFDLLEERFEKAGVRFREARELAGNVTGLLGRIEQNLGTIGSLQGDYESAMEHYRRSLEAFRAAGNDHGRAIAYHNLGVACMELGRWQEADDHLRRCGRTLEATDDLHLRGATLLNHAETLVELGRLREARLAVEGATSIFDELRAPAELANAFRVYGVVCREARELAGARAKLLLALELAGEAGSALAEAAARRELAVLAMMSGSREEAVEQLLRSTAILLRVRGAGHRTAAPRDGYPAPVRGWGSVLAAADPDSMDHAERVAGVAAATARALGWHAEREARVRLAGWLHEAGRLVSEDGEPPEEQALPGLTADLLERAQLPYGVADVIRVHRERSGTEVADDRADDTVILEGQVLGIANRWDELAHGTAPEDAALGRLAAERRSWRPDVYSALLRAIGRESGSSSAPRYRGPASRLPSAR